MRRGGRRDSEGSVPEWIIAEDSLRCCMEHTSRVGKTGGIYLVW